MKPEKLLLLMGKRCTSTGQVAFFERILSLALLQFTQQVNDGTSTCFDSLVFAKTGLTMMGRTPEWCLLFTSGMNRSHYHALFCLLLTDMKKCTPFLSVILGFGAFLKCVLNKNDVYIQSYAMLTKLFLSLNGTLKLALLLPSVFCIMQDLALLSWDFQNSTLLNFQNPSKMQKATAGTCTPTLLRFTTSQT